MSNALDGVRVVETSTGLAAAMATMILADHGADVVRIETTDGPQLEGSSAPFSRGKRRLTIESDQAPAPDAIWELISGADVLVTDHTLDEVFGLGLPEEELHARWPALVRVRMSAYLEQPGWAGARESAGLLAAAMGTAMRQTCFSGGPVDYVLPVVLYAQAVWAATAATAALIEREGSGVGQDVTVNGAQGALVALGSLAVIEPEHPARLNDDGPGGINPTYSTYECGDGAWLFLGALTSKFVDAAFEVLGAKAIMDHESVRGDYQNLWLPDVTVWVREQLAERFRQRPRDAWLELLDNADVPCGPMADRDDWLDEEQLIAIGMRVEADAADVGRIVMPGNPVVLGDPTHEVTHRIDSARPLDPARDSWASRATPEPKANQCDDAHQNGGPLSGIRVLDLGTILAGPFAAGLLAELGADVIKVEPPAGDPFRLTNFTLNRGQRGLAIDLRRPAGHDALNRLVETADVVIDNYRPGVLERLAIDYDHLKAINPGIVSVSVTGYGYGGPMSHKPGFDPVLQARSGMMSAQGGGDEPVFLTVPVNDATAGIFAALAACLAIFRRTHTGIGDRAWVSLAGTAAFMQFRELTRFTGSPRWPIGGRDFRGPAAWDRFYQVADGWVRIQADNVEHLITAGLLEATCAEATDEDIAHAVTNTLSNMRRDDAVDHLNSIGIPTAPARRLDELPADHELTQTGLLQRYDRNGSTPYYTGGQLATFSRTPRTGTPHAPGLGEHSRQVLHEVGFTEPDINQLIDDGTIIEGPPLDMPARFLAYR